MIIGYLRVSTGKQHLANQQDEIRRFAESRNLVVDHWVTEVVSGKKSERDRKLGALLRRLKKNDTLIVTEISRLSRTLTDIMAIMGKCLERGNQPLYDQGGLFVRQYDQQQGAVLRFRTRRGDRAQSYFDADARGAGAAACRGDGFGTSLRELYQTERID